MDLIGLAMTCYDEKQVLLMQLKKLCICPYGVPIHIPLPNCSPKCMPTTFHKFIRNLNRMTEKIPNVWWQHIWGFARIMPSSVAAAITDVFRKNGINVSNKFVRIPKIFTKIYDIKNRRVIYGT